MSFFGGGGPWQQKHIHRIDLNVVWRQTLNLFKGQGGVNIISILVFLSKTQQHLEKANVKASTSQREAESILCSINQPSNAAKELFIHLAVSLFIKKALIRTVPFMSATKLPKPLYWAPTATKNTVSCIVTQGLTYASRSEWSSLAGLVHGLNQWEA